MISQIPLFSLYIIYQQGISVFFRFMEKTWTLLPINQFILEKLVDKIMILRHHFVFVDRVELFGFNHFLFVCVIADV